MVRVQIAVVNSNNAGAQIQLLTENELVENSFIQLEFNDNAGTTLQESLPVSAVNATGAWNFGGPQTDGEGNLTLDMQEIMLGEVCITQITKVLFGENLQLILTRKQLAPPITSGRYILKLVSHLVIYPEAERC